MYDKVNLDEFKSKAKQIEMYDREIKNVLHDMQFSKNEMDSFSSIIAKL